MSKAIRTLTIICAGATLSFAARHAHAALVDVSSAAISHAANAAIRSGWFWIAAIPAALFAPKALRRIIGAIFVLTLLGVALAMVLMFGVSWFSFAILAMVVFVGGVVAIVRAVNGLRADRTATPTAPGTPSA